MNNYHKHTYGSNIFIVDSTVSYKDYAKRAVELGHKILSSVEHGWQGYYYEVYELAKEYNLKFIFGTEAYWVKDRTEKDKTNGHIVILAKNENGRRAINDILSEANITGYYVRPRVDLELLLSLPANDVFITTACVAFWKYDDIEDIFLKLKAHFKDNIMLEIQYHNTEQQIALNKKILALAQKTNTEMIVGLDSHYIYPEQAKERQYLLESKDVFYEDEEGWYMDYPDDNTVIERFLEQGVFTREQIIKAMNNTDICLTFEDIVLDKNIKLPTIYPNLTQKERNKIYRQLITKKFLEYTKGFSKEEYDRYYEGVKKEVHTYIATKMVDYPLLDYEIVKRALQKGGQITKTGRGSGVGYFTNTLCGFSKVDRFKSPIKLYPERFISESRILETKSLPDLDLNCGNPEIFAEAQDEVLTEYLGSGGHSYPMIAFGTLKKKSAFKLYARVMGMDISLANEISKQIDQYEEDVKNADDDDKKDINIYDYVDEKYHDYITQSQKYWGVISDKKKAPCAYLIYQGDIRSEVGLIKCKSDSTKKEYITTVIDGAVAENYKFLKNDLLKVDVVLLINKLYDRAGISCPDVDELSNLVKSDNKVWEIYSKGLTMGINQVEKASTTKKVMKFKPKNISELTAFIAAIRPAFKSMYSKFETREHFEYGIPAFDNILQTPEFPQSFILYQEQTMNTLNYAGFPIDECYGIIKAIAKKHPEKVLPLKNRFIDGFKNKLINEEKVDENEAENMSAKVWQIISDSCGYGFNSAHAFCMCLDSLYCAYFKAHYPLEFYEVMLQHYSDKGEKDKVMDFKKEMIKAFGIKEGKYKLGEDNRRFLADKENNVIYPSLKSIKGLNQDLADTLYEIGKEKSNTFFDLWIKLKNNHIKSNQIEILAMIDYFSDYGNIAQILKYLEIIDIFYERKQFKKNNLPAEFEGIIKKYSTETPKQYSNVDSVSIINGACEMQQNIKTPIADRLKYQNELLGYISYINPKAKNYVFVTDINTKYSPRVTAYQLDTGEIITFKISKSDFFQTPFDINDVLYVITEPRAASRKVGDKWVKSETEKELWTKSYQIVRGD